MSPSQRNWNAIPPRPPPPPTPVSETMELIKRREFNLTTNFSTYYQMSLLNDVSLDCPNIFIFHCRSLDTCDIFNRTLADLCNGFMPLYLFIPIVPSLLNKLILSEWMTSIVLGLSVKLFKGKKPKKKRSLIEVRLIYFVETTNGPYYSGEGRRVIFNFPNWQLIRSIPAAHYEQNASKQYQ